MELKTIKEFAHKGNLGSGLTYENGVFKATVNLNGYLHKNNLGEGLVFSNNKVNVDLDNEFNTIATSLNQLNTKVTQINEQLGTVYKVKGSTTVNGINSMTVGNAMVGNVYNLIDSGVITNGIGGELNVVKGDNVVYTEEGWDQFAASLDLNQCSGQNISIEGNIISAKGYVYNEDKKSFSEGTDTKAEGSSSHAEGNGSIAREHASHSEGIATIANNVAEHAQGIRNVSNTGTDTDTRTTLHSIGIGTASENKNAHEVMNNGDTFIIGIGDYSGTNPYEAQTLQKVVNSKVDKEEGKYLSSNDYTNSDKEKVALIEALQTIILELQEKVNSKEYSIDFESDSTTAQEINLMDSMKLKKLVGYNITGVNLQIGTGSAINLVLTDNVWEGDPIVINQGERIYWDIIKYDESAPAVLGIYETKIL